MDMWMEEWIDGWMGRWMEGGQNGRKFFIGVYLKTSLEISNMKYFPNTVTKDYILDFIIFFRNH